MWFYISIFCSLVKIINILLLLLGFKEAGILDVLSY